MSSTVVPWSPVQIRRRTERNGGNDLSSPLIDVEPTSQRESSGPSCGEAVVQGMGFRSAAEMQKVALFMTAQFLSNTFFVIGRNVGTVLFLSYVGPKDLPQAIFVSGASTVFVGQAFSSASRSRSAAAVNGWLLGIGALLIATLFLLSIRCPDASTRANSGGDMAVNMLFFAVYLAEDILTMFVAMQASTVAQAAFSVSDAKRLFGLVQLGNSIAAMTVGLSIGYLAKTFGTKQLLAVQSGVMVVSLILNSSLAEHCAPGGGKKKKGANIENSLAEDAGPWWNNFLVIALALWSFTVIFTKTMYEYQYNVLVAKALSEDDMVALTGYLYALAGLFSTVINLLGTKVCIEKIGMRGAILATPIALLSVSIAILTVPSVATTFLGRMVDLSLRWSLNNTVRSVLWIAVPTSQAVSAKPWVEGTIKKMGQAFNALVISFALALSGGSLAVLSFLSVAFCVLLLACCVRLHRLYLQSMWYRIKRRELKYEQIDQLPRDAGLKRQMLDKLLHAGATTQLDLLLQFGDGLDTADWEILRRRFHELPAAVQANIIDLNRTNHDHVPDKFLLELVSMRGIESAVQQVAIIAAGDRKLRAALDPLQVHLGNAAPEVRAAAATSILRIGWGVGLGEISSASIIVLEHMLNLPCAVGQSGDRGRRLSALSEPLQRWCSTGSTDSTGKLSEGMACQQDVDELRMSVDTMTQEWEGAIKEGNRGHALVVAIRLTHERLALQDALFTREARSRNSSGQEGGFQLPMAALDDRNLGSPIATRSLEDGSLLGSPTPHTRSNFTPWSGSAQHLQQRVAAAESADVAVALDMVRLLPDPSVLVTYDQWVELLQHKSDKVRVAALSFVREEDCQQFHFKDELHAILRCVRSRDTYAAAERALCELNRPLVVQKSVVDQLQRDRDKQNELFSNRSSDTQHAEISVHMTYLLKLLQFPSAWCSNEDLATLKSEDVCDKLLELSAGLSDADVLQEMYRTMVDLKDCGFAINREVAATRMRKVAAIVGEGIVLRQWLPKTCKQTTQAQAALLSKCVELKTVSAEDRLLGIGAESSNKIDSFLSIVCAYIDEHVYLLKLQLLQLSILAGPRTAASYRSTRVLAAWRVLRSNDAASEAAVLELLETMLPTGLRGIVLALLDSSPLEQKLSAAAVLSSELRAYDAKTSAAPPWTQKWLQRSLSVLGSELAAVFGALVNISDAIVPVSTPVATDLTPKMVLLSRIGLYKHMLSIHMAEIAAVASCQTYSMGDTLCREGESYIVVAGCFRQELTGRDYYEGDAVQEFHAVCEDKLPVQRVVCTCAEGGTVLRLSRQQLFDLMLRLPPKFALGLLKSLLRVLPQPRQTGGSRTTRVQNGAGSPLADELHVRNCSPDDLALMARREEVEGSLAIGGHRNPLGGDDVGHEAAIGTPEEIGQQPKSSITLLEKLLHLEGVKIFRYVPLEYLPSIAKCCDSMFKGKGLTICKEGDPSDAVLYIVADGSVGIFSRSMGDPSEAGGSLIRTLGSGDTMGNTGLLLDCDWSYTAKTLEDTWLLCMSRQGLTDVLRGRRDLASAVIHALYRTLSRRIQEIVSSSHRERTGSF